jgi:predicted small secreted protein
MTKRNHFLRAGLTATCPVGIHSGDPKMRKICLSVVASALVLSACGETVTCGGEQVLKTVGETYAKTPEGQALKLDQTKFAVTEVITKQTGEKGKSVSCEGKITVTLGTELAGKLKKLYSDDNFASGVIQASPTANRLYLEARKDSGLDERAEGMKAVGNNLLYTLAALNDPNFQQTVKQLEHDSVEFKKTFIKAMRENGPTINDASGTASAAVQFDASVLEDSKSKGMFQVKAVSETLNAALRLSTVILEAEKEQAKAASAGAYKDALAQLRNGMTSLVAGEFPKGISEEEKAKILSREKFSAFSEVKVATNGDYFDVGGQLVSDKTRAIHMTSDGKCLLIGFSQEEAPAKCEVVKEIVRPAGTKL